MQKSHAKFMAEVQEIVCDNYNIEFEAVSKILRSKFGPDGDYASALGHKFYTEIQNDLFNLEMSDDHY